MIWNAFPRKFRFFFLFFWKWKVRWKDSVLEHCLWIFIPVFLSSSCIIWLSWFGMLSHGNFGSSFTGSSTPCLMSFQTVSEPPLNDIYVGIFDSIVLYGFSVSLLLFVCLFLVFKCAVFNGNTSWNLQCCMSTEWPFTAAARIVVYRSGAHLPDTKGRLEEVDDRNKDRTRNLSTWIQPLKALGHAVTTLECTACPSCPGSDGTRRV